MTHQKRFDTGYGIVMITLIIIGISALGYGLIRSIIFEGNGHAIIAILGGVAVVMYLVGYLVELIQKKDGPEVAQ